MAKELNSLCSNCSRFADAEFWDPQPGKLDPYPRGYLMTRKLCDIKCSNTCPMCRLVCQALQKKGLCPPVPAADRYIYYSRLLYGIYTTPDSIAHSRKLAEAVRRTYRLRVSTRFQYSEHPEDERFQPRAYDCPDQSDLEGDIMLLERE